MIEIITRRNDLPQSKRDYDCITWLFGHPYASIALGRLYNGGGYNRLLSSDLIQEDDIAVMGIGVDCRHVGKVINGKIVGKDNTHGDVTGGSVEDYRTEGYWVKLYRRNTSPLTSDNNPFDVDSPY